MRQSEAFCTICRLSGIESARNLSHRKTGWVLRLHAEHGLLVDVKKVDLVFILLPELEGSLCTSRWVKRAAIWYKNSNISSFGKTFLCRVSSLFSNLVLCSCSTTFCTIISSNTFTSREANDKMCCCVSLAYLTNPSAVCVSWTGNRQSKLKCLEIIKLCQNIFSLELPMPAYNFLLLSRIPILSEQAPPSMTTLNIVTFRHYLNQFGYQSVMWMNV